MSPDHSGRPLKAGMIFVVGARRSGTNWLQRIVTAHPGIAGMPTESYLFSHGMAALSERFHEVAPDWPKPGYSFMPRKALLEAIRQFTDRVFAETLDALAPDATHLVERTPWHVYHLELIGDVYREAPIVHIIRDGRDVARSLLSQEWGPDKMEAAAEEWRSSVTAGRTAGASLPNYFEVSYERLLAEPAAGIRSLYEQLGLELAPDLLEHARLEALSTFNVDPAFPTVGSGKWRNAIAPRELRTFDRIAGALLEELGYEREAPRPPGVSEALARIVAGARIRARRAARPGAAIGSALDRAATRRSSAANDANALIVRRLEDEVARGRYSVLDELMASNVRVRIIDPDESWRGNGREGVERLRAALRAHEKERLRPLTTEIQPGVNGASAISAYRLGDGSTWLRTILVTRQGERADSVRLHRRRLAPIDDE